MTGETQNGVWPLPQFYFSVTGLFGAAPASFQEVTGLDSATRTVAYRQGDSPAFAPVKMPGLAKAGTVILKKGVFTADQSFSTWAGSVAMNTTARTTVVVNLLDEIRSHDDDLDAGQCIPDEDDRNRSQGRRQ